MAICNTAILQNSSYVDDKGEEYGGDDSYKYLIVWPEKAGIWNLLRYMAWGDKGRGVTFLERSDEGLTDGEPVEQRWVVLVSIIACKIISSFRKPLNYTGLVIESFLNLPSENGGIFGLLCNFLLGKLVIPRRDTETFISAIGHLDGRIDLYHAENLLTQINDSVSLEKIICSETEHRALMDICIMSSKLAYENGKVVRRIVSDHWKMHFVGFYDCWNDFQKEMSTQVLIFCDKPKDANLILIGYRGTEPFDAYNWCTDFDYCSYRIPKVGHIHVGFLEALGLGNRADPATFQYLLRNKGVDFDHAVGTENAPIVPPEMVKKSAYYKVRRKLNSLLKEHKNAKFVVTGHSLGGALAILFPCVLVLHEEMEVMRRLVGVYTFGQPRIGDAELAKFMEAHLEHPYPKYFRVVYCNDIVPRLPFDDRDFLYKHFGMCLYYDSCYCEQEVDEEPNKNFFGLTYVIPAHLNAVWELTRSFVIGYMHGPAYKEGWFSILARVFGLALPGIAAHCPTDYVNSVRLGQQRAVQMSSF